MAKGTWLRMLIMLALASALFGGLYAFQYFRNTMIEKAIKSQAQPPQTVSTVIAKESLWQPEVQAVGSLRASQEASLSAEVPGLVTAIHFDSGQSVRAGEVLVELNAAPLKAQLNQLKAAAVLAEQNYQRDLAQYRLQAVSKSVIEADEANLKSARAQVAAQEALIAQKTVRAPFSGRLGIRQVNLGQYLAPGTAIVTLQKLDPMYVDFNVPQNQVSLIRIGMKVRAQADSAPGQVFTGTITALEPQIDTATRNLKVRATLPNPKGLLLPGMFVAVHIAEGKPRSYITLPSAALTYNPYGTTAFVVTQEGELPNGQPRLVAQQRFVTPGLTRGDQVAILSGIRAGETVVTAGQLKLRNGTPVFIDNSVQPTASAHPQVPDE